jgi:exosortase A-associated hydrolase 2
MEGPSGRLFAIHHAPRHSRGNVLCIPPFNEEMNRSRSMLTLQAQAFLEAGFGTLLVDLFGTGDSDGHYVDGRWDRWLADIATASDWLRGRGGCTALLGIRLGALLATAWCRANPEATRSLIAWQPVVDGKQYLTQVLRMKLAANMDRVDAPRESTESLRAAWARGSSVEISGYEIHPELARAIDATSLLTMSPPPHIRVAWLEHASSSGPSPASKRVIDAWSASSVQIDHMQFGGDAFWQLHERCLALDVIEKTTSWLVRAEATV